MLPIPENFTSPKAEEFFFDSIEKTGQVALFLSAFPFKGLVSFFKEQTRCKSYIDPNCEKRGFYHGPNRPDACKFSYVYLIHEDVGVILSSIGKYSRMYLNGCPLTRVSTIDELTAPDVYMGFGFEDRGKPDSDIPRPEPFFVLNMGNLGQATKYISSRFRETFVVVCRIGYGDPSKFIELRQHANTSIYSLPGKDVKYLIMACDEYEDMQTCLRVLQDAFKSRPITQVVHFNQLKADGQFIVAGMEDFETVALYTKAVVKLPVAAAASQPVPAVEATSSAASADEMTDFPALPVQDEKKLHDFSFEFSHLLEKVKSFNPAKATKIEADSKTSDDPSYMEQWCKKMRSFVDKMEAAASSLE
jgi:hypothetical protein